MILMQAHARTERVAMAGLEKMLNKVRWALGEVSLYPLVEQIMAFLLVTFDYRAWELQKSDFASWAWGS